MDAKQSVAYLSARAPRGVFPGEFMASVSSFFQATGEFRNPKAGEFYLSGAKVSAYYTKNDLDSPYWIACKVVLQPGEIIHNGKIYAPKADQ